MAPPQLFQQFPVLNNSDETYCEEGRKRRAAATLKRILQTPHKTHKESKKGRKLGA